MLNLDIPEARNSRQSYYRVCSQVEFRDCCNDISAWQLWRNLPGSLQGLPCTVFTNNPIKSGWKIQMDTSPKQTHMWPWDILSATYCLRIASPNYNKIPPHAGQDGFIRREKSTVLRGPREKRTHTFDCEHKLECYYSKTQQVNMWPHN